MKTRETKNSSYHKAKILSLIKKNGEMKLSDLAIQLEVTRPTIYGHIEVLKSRGLVTLRKNDKLKGAPVFVNLTAKADPIDLDTLEKSHHAWENVIALFK